MLEQANTGKVKQVVYHQKIINVRFGFCPSEFLWCWVCPVLQKHCKIKVHKEIRMLHSLFIIYQNLCLIHLNLVQSMIENIDCCQPWKWNACHCRWILWIRLLFHLEKDKYLHKMIFIQQRLTKSLRKSIHDLCHQDDDTQSQSNNL